MVGVVFARRRGVGEERCFHQRLESFFPVEEGGGGLEFFFGFDEGLDEGDEGGEGIEVVGLEGVMEESDVLEERFILIGHSVAGQAAF